MGKLIVSLLGSAFRHVLSSLGGVLVAAGVSRADADAFLLASEPVVAGLALFLGSLLLSFYEKKRAKK